MAVAVIVDRDTGAKEKIEAEAGVPYLYAFSKDELGVWGMKWEDVTFTGYVDGEAVTKLEMAADPVPTTLQVVADAETVDATTRDTVRVIIRALDQKGNKLAFLNDVVSIAVSGAGERIGPASVALQGGATGFWLRATGRAGEITVTVTTTRLGTKTLTLTAV